VGNGKIAEQETLGQLPRGYITGIYGIEQWRVSDGSFTKLRELSFSYNVGKMKGFNDLTISLADATWPVGIITMAMIRKLMQADKALSSAELILDQHLFQELSV
jgi:hypothetical protein